MNLTHTQIQKRKQICGSFLILTGSVKTLGTKWNLFGKKEIGKLYVASHEFWVYPEIFVTS